jgi:hypothetical protein
MNVVINCPIDDKKTMRAAIIFDSEYGGLSRNSERNININANIEIIYMIREKR